MTEGHGDRTRVLFMGGTGRSGSTLLERMTAEIPGVCALGEVVHLWQRSLLDDDSCGCGEAFSSCDFWQAVGERAFGGWDRVDASAVLALKSAVDRTRFVPRLALPMLTARVAEDLRAYLDYYERLYAAAAHVSGATVVVDSSKHASLALCLMRSARIDLRVVHVVRDSPGVAYSWSKQVLRPESRTEQSWMPRYSTGRAVLDWWTGNSIFGALGVAGKVRLVRYEDLVADPRHVLTTVAQHAGLRVGPDDLGFVSQQAVVLAPTHSVAGNPMRFTVGAIPLRPDDEWRSRLPATRRRLVKTLTFPLRARFGYVGRSPRGAHALTAGVAR